MHGHIPAGLCSCCPCCNLRRERAFLSTQVSIKTFLTHGPFPYLFYLCAFERVPIRWSWAEAGTKLIYCILLEPQLQWKQSPCPESCNHTLNPPVICQPRAALPGALLPRGSCGLTRAVAPSLCLPLTVPPSSLLPPSPVPSMQFAKDLLLVKEKEGVLHVPIIRSGDLSYESSVRCYTQSHSAQVMEDFEERRNADSSRITFLKGEKVSGFVVAERWGSLLLWCLHLSIVKWFR